MNKYILTGLMSVVLTACGGGAGGASTDAGNVSQQFVGAWQSICYQDVDIKGTNGANVGTLNALQTPPGSNLYVTQELDISRVDNTNLTYKLKYKVYSSNDTSCSGTSLGNIFFTGLNTMAEQVDSTGITSSYGSNEMAVAGTATLSDGKVVTQMAVSLTKLLNGTKTAFAGNDGTGKSGFGTTTGDFPAYSNLKAITFINGVTLRLEFANEGEPYPNIFDTNNEIIYTKQ